MSTRMPFIYDDGGRAAAGYKGKAAGDCVCRAIAIATGLSYQKVYDDLNALGANERGSNRRRGKSSARTGVYKATIRSYMKSIGWQWVPTMRIGSGCTVHLAAGELPDGRLVVSVSKHLTAVINGVVHDIYDPQREVHACVRDIGQELKPGETRNVNGVHSVQRRCVYGYYVKA